MLQRLKRFLCGQLRAKQMLLACVCFQLLLSLSIVTETMAQGGVSVAASCPTSCDLRISITSAKLRERSDGIDAVVEWTVTQPAPEIKLTGFAVTATIEYKSVGKDESTVGTKADVRQAVVKLQSGGFNKDIKFSDIATFKVKVLARTEPVPSINVTDINSIRIVGEGGDSAVDVSWRAPNPMPCSASVFVVKVKAINEKGDRLEGEGQAAITARSIRVQLKGDVNKKGLRNPEATVRLLNSIVSCERVQNFPPTQEGVGGGVGSTAPNPVVTLKPITFQPNGSRIDAFISWDVVEPTGFRATKFEIKVDTELTNGQVFTSTRVANGTERSSFGSQSQNDLSSVTATIKATFTNAANTSILFREDKRTDKFSAKAALLDIQKPVQPTQQNITLNVTNVKVLSKANVHSVVATWQVNVPANVTLTSFEINAQIAGNQAEPKRSVVVLSTQRTATINFTFDEAGNQVSSARVQVIANVRRADGSTFQQKATGSSN